MSDQNKYPLTPSWYAFGGFFTTPVLATTLLLGAVILFAVWPFTPMIFYLKRKSELQQNKEVKL